MYHLSDAKPEFSLLRCFEAQALHPLHPEQPHPQPFPDFFALTLLRMMKNTINTTASSSTMDMIFSEIHNIAAPPIKLSIANQWLNKNRHKADHIFYRARLGMKAEAVFTLFHSAEPLPAL